MERRRRKPAQPDSGIKTDYLWLEVLSRKSLTNILENYAQIVEEKDEKTRQEEADPGLASLSSARCGSPAPGGRRDGTRRRAAVSDPALGGQREEQLHRLAGPPTDRTDREGRRLRPSTRSSWSPTGVILDRQIRDTIKQYAPGRRDGGARGARRRPAPVHRVGQEDHHLDGSEVPLHPQTRSATSSAGSAFAIIIDEAHSSQGGRTSSASMAQAALGDSR